jgi:adenosylcobinamide-GDP ribazoletransferase
VVLAAIAEPARADGLGRAAVLEIRPVDTSVATISALGIGSVAAGVWLVPVVVLAALSLLFWRGLATRRLGGVTGDVLGACEQVVEILALTTVAVAAWNGVPPWWA